MVGELEEFVPREGGSPPTIVDDNEVGGFADGVVPRGHWLLDVPPLSAELPGDSFHPCIEVACAEKEIDHGEDFEDVLSREVLAAAGSTEGFGIEVEGPGDDMGGVEVGVVANGGEDIAEGFNGSSLSFAHRGRPFDVRDRAHHLRR